MSFRNLGLCALVLLPLACSSAPPPAAEPPSAGTATEAAPPPAADAAAQPQAAAPMAARPATDEAAQKSTESAGGGSTKPEGASVVDGGGGDKLGGGTLTQAEIRDVVLKNAELFDACYTLGAGKSRDFVATVTVKATVAASGNVTDTRVIKSNANNKKVDTCVSDAFKKIKFPPPKGAATAVITFPIEFNGTEEVRP